MNINSPKFGFDYALLQTGCCDAEIRLEQGRTEDVALLVGWDVASSVQAYSGYRTVEGGADGGGGVYNFTWLQYAVEGATWKF